MKKKLILFFILSVGAGIVLGRGVGMFFLADAPCSLIDSAPKGDGARTFDSREDISLNTRADKRRNVSFDLRLEKYRRMKVEEIPLEIRRLESAVLRGNLRDISSLPHIWYLANKWGREAPRQAIQEVGNYPYMKTYFMPFILMGWAEKDPESAVACYTERIHDAAVHSSKNLQALTITLMTHFPEIARMWINKLPSEEKAEAMRLAFVVAAREHPEEISSMAVAWQTEAGQDDLLRDKMVEKWAGVDWNAASEWIESLPHEKRIEALASALHGLGLKDQELANQKFYELPKVEQEQVLPALVSCMIDKSTIIFALDWIVSSVSPEQRAWAAKSAMDCLDSGDNGLAVFSDGLKKHVSLMASSGAKDDILEQMLNTPGRFNNSFSDIDYKELLSFVAQMSDTHKKETQEIRIWERWITQEPETACGELEKSTLSPQRKKEYLEKCKLSIDRKKEKRLQEGTKKDEG